MKFEKPEVVKQHSQKLGERHGRCTATARLVQREQLTHSCFRLSRSLAHWLCIALLLMSQDIETNPGPEDNINFLQFFDWRFTQLWQGINLNAVNICKTMDDRFKGLERTLRHITEELNTLKEHVWQGAEDIHDLKDENEVILCRLQKLEEKQESTEVETKRCNLKFFGIPEPRRGMNYSSVEQVVDILNDYSYSRSWNQSDISRAFRVGDHRNNIDEPRPLVVQFHLWTDKMSIITDKELREDLRRDGIKVTSDLTSRQREMLDFYRSQGQIAYYRNGRLHFADKRPQHFRARYNNYGFRDREEQHNGHTDHDQTMHGEDWPHLVRPRPRQEEAEDDYWQDRDRSSKPRHNDQRDTNISSRNIQAHHQARPQQARNGGDETYDDNEDPSYREGLWSYNRRPHQSSGINLPRLGKSSRDQNKTVNFRKHPTDTDSRQYIVPGIQKYSEVVESEPPTLGMKQRHHNRPPINKARGLDARPRPQYHGADMHGTQTHRHNSLDRYNENNILQITVNNDNAVRHVQTTLMHESDQQEAHVQTTLMHESEQQETDVTEVKTKLDNNHDRDDDDEKNVCADRNSALANDMGDSDTDARKETKDNHSDQQSEIITKYTEAREENTESHSDQHLEKFIKGSETDRVSDNDEICGGHDITDRVSDNDEICGGQDITEDKDTGIRQNEHCQTVTDGHSLIHHNQIMDSQRDEEAGQTEAAADCGQTRQTETHTEGPEYEQTNTQGTVPLAEPDEVPDRPVRNRRRTPSAPTRPAKGTPQSAKSSSQPNIIDTLQQMRSVARGKEGSQEMHRGVKTRTKSVSNK